MARTSKEATRLQLGRWLAVVLEFLLSADILRTAVAPTWSDVPLHQATSYLAVVGHTSQPRETLRY